MNKYQKAFNTIWNTLVYYTVRRDAILLPSDNEICDAQAVLSKLVDKAESLEWIPVSERLPEEHDSIFAKLYGTDKWDSRLHRTVSNRVLVTIKYDDGTRIVKESHIRDGEWSDEKRCMNCKEAKEKLEHEN